MQADGRDHEPPPRPRRVGAKGRRTEQALKEAARTVIARDGFLNARIGDITAAAGRSPGLFYSYFDNKEQLLEALLDDFLSVVMERTQTSAQRQVDRYASIRAAIATFWQTYREYQPELVAVQHAATVDAQFLRTWFRLRAVGMRNIEARVRTAQREGVFPAHLDATVAASMLSSMLEYSCYLWLGMAGDAPGRPAGDDAAIETMATLWYRAIWGGERG